MPLILLLMYSGNSQCKQLQSPTDLRLGITPDDKVGSLPATPIQQDLRESGCIALPSQRTVWDYTYFLDSRIGFTNDVDKHLTETANLSSLADYQKCVAVIMHIKEDLVFNKHSGDLVGFANLGSVNNLLLQCECSLECDDASPDFAKSMFVFLVRGLFIQLNFPYAQFACKSVSGDLPCNPLCGGCLSTGEDGVQGCRSNG